MIAFLFAVPLLSVFASAMAVEPGIYRIEYIPSNQPLSIRGPTAVAELADTHDHATLVRAETSPMTHLVFKACANTQ